MSAIIKNEPYVATVRSRIETVARGMLSGEIMFLEGAIELASLRHEAAVSENDPDFMVFVGISSEIDELPIGQFRKNWSPEALEMHQPRIEEMTTWAKKIGSSTCEALVKRFE